MKAANVQKLPANFATHTNMGAMVGLCVDDLLFDISNKGPVSRIEVTIEQKELAKGDRDWTITAIAEINKQWNEVKSDG